MVRQPQKKIKKSRKPDSDKKLPNGLSQAMMEWIRKEAQGRGVYAADIIREGMEWYRTALDTQRGDDTVQDLFKNNPIKDPITKNPKEIK